MAPTFALQKSSDSNHPMVVVRLRSEESLLPLGGCPKQSTCSKQDDYTPYLSYDYLPSKDKFRVRIKMNYSKKKRGIRVKEDFQNIHELAECASRLIASQDEIWPVC